MKQIFCEASGQLSSTRVNCFIILIYTLLLTTYAVYSGKVSEDTTLILSLLGLALGAKTVSKFAEAKP